MAMVVLVILTILGLSAMRVSVLETRMAGNIQDSTIAFQAAESGLAKALNTGGSFNIHAPVEEEFSFHYGNSTVTTSFVDFAPPKRGSGFSVIHYDVANFDQGSTGKTSTGGQSVVHRGVYQIVNKSS
jgi:hypothetical protein